jgi:hypothetical protein
LKGSPDGYRQPYWRAFARRSPGPHRPVLPAVAADRAAHDKSSYVQPVAVRESDPDWLSPAGQEALRRLEADRVRVLRRQFDAALVERGMSEYEAWIADGQVAA